MKNKILFWSLWCIVCILVLSVFSYALTDYTNLVKTNGNKNIQSNIKSGLITKYVNLYNERFGTNIDASNVLIHRVLLYDQIAIVYATIDGKDYTIITRYR